MAPAFAMLGTRAPPAQHVRPGTRAPTANGATWLPATTTAKPCPTARAFATKVMRLPFAFPATWGLQGARANIPMPAPAPATARPPFKAPAPARRATRAPLATRAAATTSRTPPADSAAVGLHAAITAPATARAPAAATLDSQELLANSAIPPPAMGTARPKKMALAFVPPPLWGPTARRVPRAVSETSANSPTPPPAAVTGQRRPMAHASATKVMPLRIAPAAHPATSGRPASTAPS